MRSKLDHEARRRATTIAGLSLLALGGTFASAGCDRAPESVAQAHSAVTAACSDGRRWVTEVPGPSCPPIDPWTETHLLGSVAGAPTYCVYEWNNASTVPQSTDIAALEQQLGTTLEEDCIFVSSLASPVERANTLTDSRPPTNPFEVSMDAFGQDLRRELRSRFAEGAGAVKIPRSTSAEPNANPIDVRVTVIDAEPDSHRATHPGFIPHGAVMAGLIGDLSCPDTSNLGPDPAACVTEVVTKLALPHQNEKDAPDWEHGGQFGTIGELSYAISTAVDEWESALPSAPRLVLNLSVGIQPGPVCVADPRLPGTPILVRALHHAIRKAACRGAIVVTAAGNAPGAGAYAPGATCPAAWASLPVPSPAECAIYVSPTGSAAPVVGYPDPGADAPLVYAVHGLDAMNTPVTNARDGARGWIAAAGLLGVSSDGTTDLPTPFTGSSVAAAAVSGIAATVWAYRPDLSARAVMDLVHTTGTLLPQPATLCPPGGAASHPPVGSINIVDKAIEQAGACSARRASLCDALTAACDGGGARCPNLPACVPRAVEPMQNAPLSATLVEEMTKLGTTVIPVQIDGEPLDAQPAPPMQDPTDRWVRPQPTIPPCGPACGLDRLRSLVFVSIDPAYRAPMQNVTLWLTDGYDVAHGYWLGENLVSDTLYTFAVRADVSLTRTATLVFQVDARTSIREQIAIR